MGGFRQGQNAAAAAYIVKDAVALEAAGARAVVVECVPSRRPGGHHALEAPPSASARAAAPGPSPRLPRPPRLRQHQLAVVFVGGHPRKGDANFEPAYDDYDVEDKDEDEDEDDEMCRRRSSASSTRRWVRWVALRSFVDEVHSGAFPARPTRPTDGPR